MRQNSMKIVRIVFLLLSLPAVFMLSGCDTGPTGFSSASASGFATGDDPGKYFEGYP
jgi:hypothetical protein